MEDLHAVRPDVAIGLHFARGVPYGLADDPTLLRRWAKALRADSLTW